MNLSSITNYPSWIYNRTLAGQANPLIPMMAITGRPSREELVRILGMYRSVGIRQILIYPRSGLEVEYMGQMWLEICRHVIEYCAAHDMSVWLYDEYNWPSGKCRGKVIRRNVEYAAKKRVAFSDRNFLGAEHPDARASEYYWTEVKIPLYADLLNPDAVDCFIELTHEVYHKHFGQYFGSTIRGIFSDEPSFMYSKFQPVEGSALEVPCYEGLEKDYAKKTGRRLIPDFESYLSGSSPDSLWPDYYSLMGERFCREYLGKLREWCETRGIAFTGHLMDEPAPHLSIGASGNPVAAIRSFSVPGIDEIGTEVLFEKIEWNTFKLLESTLNGPRHECLAELFALGPSDMTLTTMRQMIYLAALHGVTHYVTAISALDAKGNVEKPYYYNAISPTQPWFPFIAGLGEAAAEAAELAHRHSTASIALRYPQKLYCSEWNHRWKHQDRPDTPVDYTELVRALLDAQWEFRLIDAEEIPAPNHAVVLDLTRQGAQDERTGRCFDSISDVLAFLENSRTRRVRLLNKDGSPVRRVLVKSFDDGSACIINTSGKELREVTLGAGFFDIPAQGVRVISPGKMSDKIEYDRILDIGNQIFSCEIGNSNTRRCFFPTGKEEIIHVDTEAMVRVALRQYGGQVTVTLDGQRVQVDAGCETLPEGFCSLYRESDPIALARGRHVLRLENTARDYPYLPLAFVTGRFSNGPDGTLRLLPRMATVDEFIEGSLTEYAGLAIFRGQVNFEGYQGVSIAHRNLAVELLVDGESLGPRLWEPFVWPLPQKFRSRKAQVELRMATSIGRIFADYPKHGTGEQLPLVHAYWPGYRK
ncbi:hypothetical protein OpiT1DRAFT_00690 [Opitutaceae bacterium TAV1]|nr:hypothetical protein OpiT1DRAFT_00690 [Opitutaceae bacterium TAV1]